MFLLLKINNEFIISEYVIKKKKSVAMTSLPGCGTSYLITIFRKCPTLPLFTLYEPQGETGLHHFVQQQ